MNNLASTASTFENNDYESLAQSRSPFHSLSEPQPQEIGAGILACPIGRTFESGPFTAIVLRELNRLRAELTESSMPLLPAAENELRQKAVNYYLDVNIFNRAAPKEERDLDHDGLMKRTLELVRDTFPHEPYSPYTWGKVMFEKLMGIDHMLSFDEHGEVSSEYDSLRAHVYLKSGEPVAISGLYAENNHDLGWHLGGGRIAIAPEYQRTGLFGRIALHIGEQAAELVAEINAKNCIGIPFPAKLVSFSGADAANQRVIDLYKSLGFSDTGLRFEYAESPQMLLELDLSPSAPIWKHVERLKRRV